MSLEAWYLSGWGSVGFLGLAVEDAMVCWRRALDMEACNLYCSLYIIYLASIYNYLIAKGS